MRFFDFGNGGQAYPPPPMQYHSPYGPWVPRNRRRNRPKKDDKKKDDKKKPQIGFWTWTAIMILSSVVIGPITKVALALLVAMNTRLTEAAGITIRELLK